MDGRDAEKNRDRDDEKDAHGYSARDWEETARPDFQFAILIWFKFISGVWSEGETCFKGGKNARVR